MAITVTAKASSRSSGTSHSFGPVILSDGTWGIFMVLVDGSPQPTVTDISIDGNSCTKKVEVTNSSNLTHLSIWVYDATGGEVSGTVTGTTDNTGESVISICDVSGFAAIPFGNTATKSGYEVFPNESSLSITPTYQSGAIIGVGGSEAINVRTVLDGTTIHNLYTFPKNYIGSHYKSFANGNDTTLKWDWDDAGGGLQWADCLLEVADTNVLPFVPQITFI